LVAEKIALEIVQADLENDAHQRAIVELIDAYAQNPMIYGDSLPERVRRELVPGLRRHPTTVVLLGFDGDKPVGLVIAFVGFSTFAARPLLNIHDITVLEQHQGQGIGRALLAAVEAKARELGCCKVTLEVDEDNEQARRVYAAAGFQAAAAGQNSQRAFFLKKPLD